MTAPSRIGAKVRALRRRRGISQAKLAESLGISASYLNLIENNKRPLQAALLIKVARLFEVDLDYFASDEDARLIADLYEVFSDPLFESSELTSTELREAATNSPPLARAIVSLYGAYESARRESESLAFEVSEGESLGGRAPRTMPSEEVSDFIQDQANHFDALERCAETLWKDAELRDDQLYSRLVAYLKKRHGASVEVGRWDAMGATLREFDPGESKLLLSELLPTRSRNFQLSHQIGLLENREVFDAVLEKASFRGEEAYRLARIALANYFAGAVLMPYDRFLQAARQARYDLDVIGRRFRVGFEQVCHRLSTMRRPGSEGVPFHFLRIDIAGNISKRFSGSGIRFARFGGACPRWNVFQAFLTPGMLRVQISTMPDGARYFAVARSVQRDSSGYHDQQPVMAVGIGCQIEHAHELVYADGINLEDLSSDVPVGVSCRLCERTDCNQRAHPSLRQPLHIDENVRAVSLYSTPGKDKT